MNMNMDMNSMNEAMTKGYEQMAATTQAQLAKFAPAMAKGFDEWNMLAKANMDAMVQAATVAGKGWEAVAELMLTYNKQLAEQGIANATALASVKSFDEAVKLQTGMVRKGIDEMMTQGAKVSELSAKVATEAAGPIAAQVNETVKKATPKAA